MGAPFPGLCATCAHRHTVTTRRSAFVLCRLSRTDPRFARYPRLPVIACAGFAPAAAEPPAGGAGGPRAGGDPP